MNVNKNIFRLLHVVGAIEKIEKLVSGISFDDFMEDWMRQDATVRNFQIIGGALKNIDQSIVDNNPQVSWRNIKGMRNILVHEYFGVAYDQLWKTIIDDLPSFKIEIQKILNDLQS